MMNDDLDIRPIQAADIPAITRLMLSVHGKKTRLNEAYLTWQYVDNPDGEAIGYNAWDGDALVAHYACLPVTFTNAGAEASSSVAHRWLWSLNTATHPDYRGQGLFPLLAEKTYTRGVAEDFTAVIGVANAQSAGGFTGRLGFESLGQLAVYCSIYTNFSSDWVSRRLNLTHRLRSLNKTDNRQKGPLVSIAYRSIPLVGKVLRDGTRWGPHCYIGLRRPTTLIGVRLPEWLKPSPWIAIYLPLGKGPLVDRACCGSDSALIALSTERIQIECLDSDSI